MHKISRFFRHIFMTRAAARKTFPAAALQAIQAKIAAGEKLHRAEIRLIVEPALSVGELLQGVHARSRARELFSQYRVWDTEENCGVLVYINLADHKVEIVADRASGRALQAAEWKAVCDTMTGGFAGGLYEQSALTALEMLNELLQRHFPGSGDSANELSNRPLIV